MTLGLRLWKTYMIQVFHSPLFWISVLLTAVTASFHLIYQSEAIADVVNAFLLLLHLDAFRKILPLFAAFPFVAQFSKEWKSRIFDSILYRSNVHSYVTSQICTCAVSSFLVCFLGLMMFVVYARIQKPWDTGLFEPCPPYGFWLSHGMPFGYIIIISSIFSLSCSLWSMCGLALSAIFPNIYVALVSPFICSYLVEHLTNQCPAYMKFFTMTLGVQVLNTKSGIVNYLYTFAFYLFWIILVGTVFGLIIRKRVRNEIH